LKLNPDKCVFGVEVGKFLSFLLTERGIEANLDKCITIRDVESRQCERGATADRPHGHPVPFLVSQWR